MSVVSRSRSSMFIRTVPFLVTICFRLKVFCFSRGGSNAVLRSAKGSASCTRASRDFRPLSSCMALGCLPPVAPSEGVDALWPMPGCIAPPPVRFRCPLSPSPRRLAPMSGGAEEPVPPWALPPLPGGVMVSWSRGPSSAGKKAMFAVTGRSVCALSPASTPRRRIFMSAFSIFLAVTFSKVWKATSSGLVSRTWGWPVSWRKRQSARMTCETSSAPLLGNLLVPIESLTVLSKTVGTTACEAATRPSLPWRSRRSSGISFLVFWRSMTAVMK
mmetsp:Transcript_57566/g.154207  ORF Transcript_57566/g.154207 Transcript_57566/m.154207 type:complete len:273 (+) Transcript_57566:529-1347(+)